MAFWLLSNQKKAREVAFKSTHTYKFCPQCGGPLERRIVKSAGPERLVCHVCRYVLYEDPKVAVIAVVPKDGGVVMTLPRRAPGLRPLGVARRLHGCGGVVGGGGGA